MVETPRTLYSPRVPELSKDMQLAVQNKLNKLKLGKNFGAMRISFSLLLTYTTPIDAVLHLARFDKERVMNEAKCEAEERKEKKELLRLQKIRYQREREGRRRREELVQAKEREDIQAWRKNQVVKEEREKRELKFELTALLRKGRKWASYAFCSHPNSVVLIRVEEKMDAERARDRRDFRYRDILYELEALRNRGRRRHSGDHGYWPA